MPRKKKRLRARVTVRPDPNGPAIIKWASGYTRAELEDEKYRIRSMYETPRLAPEPYPAQQVAVSVALEAAPAPAPAAPLFTRSAAAEAAAIYVVAPEAAFPAPADDPVPADVAPASPGATAPAGDSATIKPPPGGQDTFETYAAHWYQLYKEPKIKRNTKKMYENVFINHLYPRIGSLPLESITRDTLQEMLNRHYSTGVSSSLIDKIILVLRAVFGDAFEEDVIKKDPTSRLDPPEGTFDDPIPLEMHEVDALTKELPLDKKDGLLPLLLIWTGLRRGEMYGLKWSDIQGNVLSVHRAVIFDDNQPIVTDPKSDAGYRDIPIPEPLLSMLNECRGDPDGFVFGGEKPWTESKSRRTWSRIRKNHEILATHTMHEMRHTYNQILRFYGVDPATIQYLMGHADYETTVENYTDITDDDTNRALELISLPQTRNIRYKTLPSIPIMCQRPRKKGRLHR